jgi:hypothetical protein
MADTTNNRGRSQHVPPNEIVDRARRVLDDLGGMEPERVVGLEADDDGGWRVEFEVVEVRRVPDTADILARYEVSMTKAGQFRAYRQVGRRRRADVEDPR